MVLSFLSFSTSVIPSGNLGLGKTTAAARASAAHSYQCVCILVRLNNGVVARVGDFFINVCIYVDACDYTWGLYKHCNSLH